ncbi:Hypothetical predicted protein [Mytilus galloprovincialis]|uniref:Uncharacterized protein n=1 Tax=Mytilus galloprovincialis TaxID=29158 RepID=A0A8B6G0P0_MYTGA|nr:Hypothetical predicted protein [Mytilus galloprovincialis]
MHSQNSIVDSCKIDGLIVRAYDSDMKITLPSTFARDILPAKRAHIPTGDMARRWPQLEKIASQLMPVSDCEFGLLIETGTPTDQQTHTVVTDETETGTPTDQQTHTVVTDETETALLIKTHTVVTDETETGTPTDQQTHTVVTDETETGTPTDQQTHTVVTDELLNNIVGYIVHY